MKPEWTPAFGTTSDGVSWHGYSVPVSEVEQLELDSIESIFANSTGVRGSYFARRNALDRIRELHVNYNAQRNNLYVKDGTPEMLAEQVGGDSAIKSNIKTLNKALAYFPLNVRVKIAPDGYFSSHKVGEEVEEARRLKEATEIAIAVIPDAIQQEGLAWLEKLCYSWIQNNWAKTDDREISYDLSNYHTILLGFPPEALAILPKEAFSDDSSFSLQDKIKFLRRNLPSTFDTLRKWFDLKSTSGSFQSARAIHLKSTSEALQTALSELEAMEARPLPSGLTEKEEAKIYREHVRKVRRIFESLGSDQVRVLDCPNPGESLTSLREKRIAHFSALRADYAARQVKLEEEKKEHARQELMQSEFDAPYRRGCTERESLSRPAKPFAGISDIGSSSGKKSYGVLFGGLFGISLCMALYSLYQDETPSLSWTVLLCALWASGILLWESNKQQAASIARRSKAWGAKWLFPFIKGLWKVFSWTFVLWMVSYLISRQKETHEKAVIIANYGIPAYLFCQYLVWLALDSLKEKD